MTPIRVFLLIALFVSSTKFMRLKDVCAASMNSKSETDQVSLLAFKDGITANAQGILDSWNGSSSDFCQWKGVTCGRRHQRVITLELPRSGLTGWISPSIGNLTFLRSINLSNNSLYGKIPAEIGKLSRLQNLRLTNNSLGGSVPSNLSQCSNLRGLYLAMNKLEGNIPNELTTLSKLVDLVISINKLSGGIPLSIGNMSSLERIFMGENNLEGSIPSTIAQLRRLTLLSLVENKFYGAVPSALYNISSLNILAMTSNRLHGNLPQNIGITLPKLRLLDLGTNRFSGPIPISLSNASQLQELDLSANNLVGNIPPSLGSLQDLQILNFGRNHLGSGKVGDLDFITSLTNCESLIELGLSGNILGGFLPSSISNLSTNLNSIFLGHNRVYGTIPASIGNYTNLNILTMEKNFLNGSIPSSLGNLQNLEGLYLDGNRLTGNIPPSLGNNSILNVMNLANNYLEGNIPSTLGQCKLLQRLKLSENNLGGTIPKQLLTGLSSLSLTALDVSRNSFTGPLPLEIGNLKSLWYLDISGNKLNGSIPVTLGSCVSLKFLYLAQNSLEGEIPKTINALKDLSDLDLSQNNLSGSIPKYLESLPLSILNLSHNNLEGEVPKDGVFRNSSRIFVKGNTKLCGGIVELHLPRCTETQSIKRGRPLHIKILIAAITSAVGCLFLIFCAVVSCRMRKPKRKLSSTPSMDRFGRIKPSYEDLFKATEGFSSNNLIGSGSFGCVYRGVLSRDDTLVAVKVLNLQQRGASKTFKAECNALRNIRHRNLVKILTSCSSIDPKGNDFKALVFEFMPNGSLEQWLHPRLDNKDGESRKLSLIQRTNILVDVAFALDYLHHHCHSMIVHCDLKPSNVLLDAEMKAHVGDFGLARLFSQEDRKSSYSTQSSSIGIKGSIGYSAPEYGIGSEASTQGDVYSFGILLLEMMTGRRPTDEMFRDGLNLHIFAKMALPERVMQIVDPGLLLDDTMRAEGGPSRSRRHSRGGDEVQEWIVKLVKVGVNCSLEAPRERIDMSNVSKELHLIRNNFLDVMII